ncbi:hypothetical protein C8J57DRAFT_1275904 [Mycena rebaudengoi]|nr:hypothetical protein C8J57DRAFT_1275904 [Mycena rebaudengoi]
MRDDGVPCLEPAQLKAAWGFLGRETAGDEGGAVGRGRRVLVTAPRAHAADAMGVGVGACVRVQGLADEKGDANEYRERMHALLVRWHDLPDECDPPPAYTAPAFLRRRSASQPPQAREARTVDAKRLPVLPRAGTSTDSDAEGLRDRDRALVVPGGLQEAWRGVLSRGGIEYLGRVLAGEEEEEEEETPRVAESRAGSMLPLREGTLSASSAWSQYADSPAV